MITRFNATSAFGVTSRATCASLCPTMALAATMAPSAVAAAAAVLPVLADAQRHQRYYNMLARKHRRYHTHQNVPSHHSSWFGGRLANFRATGNTKNKKAGAQFTMHMPTLQYNIDIWNAQQTLRRRWKGRNYRVVEMPFELAPRVLQRVVPEKHTELPIMSDPANGDFSNLRAKTFAQEELQTALFGTAKFPMPVERGTSKVALDTFFSDASTTAPR